MKYLKKIFLIIFESSYNLFKLKQKNKSKSNKILVIGDGISSVYASEMFSNYAEIIVVNNAINLINLEKCNIIYHIALEPDLLIKNRYNNFIRIIKERHTYFKTVKLLLNPYGRLFNIKYKLKNTIYLNPYHKIKKNKNIIYDDFTSAFQASLGLAIYLGYKEVECVGFDAWLLTPKNNTRWYADIVDCKKFDEIINIKAEDFLLKASKQLQLSTYTYLHYRSRYSFVNEIEVNKEYLNNYYPKIDRHLFASDNFSKYLEKLIFNRRNQDGSIKW